MIIEKVDLRGFGSLCDRVFRFSPALNVVIGANEAGKSTLLEALQVLLYGHFRDSAAWAGAAASERFRPWSGAEYAGTVQLRLANGDQYRIERRFDDECTTIFRNPGATDVTTAYGPGPHGWVEFADHHLGLTPSIFRACAYIHQDDLAPDRDDVKLLHARLKALADSGGTEQSAQDAMNALDAWLADRVKHVQHGVGNSPLERAEATVRDLQDQLKASRNALDDLACLVADGMRCAAADARLRGELQRLDRLIAWREADDLEAKLRGLADAESRMADRRAEIERLADVATLTEAPLDEANRLLIAASRLRDDVERITAQARRADDDRPRIDRNLTELAAELNRLPPATRAPLADLAAAQSAVEQWECRASRFRAATDSLEAFQRSRKEAEANRDARLNRLPRVTVAKLRRAIDAAANGQSDLDRAEQKVAEHPTESDIRPEYQILQTQLQALSADELSRMRDLATDLKADEARRSAKMAPLVRPAAAMGAIVGLVVGYGLFDTIGAAVGTIGLGAGAYGLVSLVSARRTIELPSTSHVLLDKWVAEYGARSIDELQRCWEHRLQLREQLAKARSLQENADAVRRKSAVALDDLERVSGTRDLDAAKQSLALLEVWMRQQSDLDRSEAEYRETMERARRELSDGQLAAHAALERLGIASDDSIQARRSLDELRAARERRAALVQRQSELQADLDRHEQTVQALAERRSQLALADGVARQRLAAVGIDGGPESWAGDLARRRDRFQAYQNATQTLDVQERIKRALVGSDNPNEWWTKLAERRSVGVRPDGSDARTLDDLRTEAKRLRGELDDARTRLAQIETRREERINSFAEPAEIEEQLADATASLSRLQHLSSVLQEARSLIKTVADEHRRNFAPRLGDGVSSWLDPATSHRYVRAEVSPADLSVALESHDRGGLVALDQVSRGTRDAVALLYRASVVDLLSNAGEPVPLFLDDPLVNVDAERTQSILEILGNLAQSRQIFYCTHDPGIVEWVGQRGQWCVHRLADPSR